jgi:hypothetical protein
MNKIKYPHDYVDPNDELVNAEPKVKHEEVYGRSIENAPESNLGKTRVYEFDISRQSKMKIMVDKITSIYRKCIK